MRNKLINISIFFASIIIGSKKYKTSNGKIFVNLGCGLRCLSGWVNIDGSLTSLFGSRCSWWNKIIYKLAGSSTFYSFKDFDKIVRSCDLHFYDLRRGIPLSTNSTDVIYASHFLEHLNKKDGFNFLSECHRVLKPGGLLRLAVPDLDIAFKMYQDGKIKEMLDLFFYTSENYDFHMHKYNYNFNFLASRLKEAGFSNAEKMAYQKGKCPNIDFLDVYPEHSLYIEAIKKI